MTTPEQGTVPVKRKRDWRRAHASKARLRAAEVYLRCDADPVHYVDREAMAFVLTHRRTTPWGDWTEVFNAKNLDCSIDDLLERGD